MSMTKDEAQEIIHQAGAMTMDQLVEAYDRFQAVVTNTPPWLGEPGLAGCKPVNFQEGLHAAIGLCTEAAELVQEYLRAEQIANIRQDQIKEECGDVFFYWNNLARAYGLDRRSLLDDSRNGGFTTTSSAHTGILGISYCAGQILDQFKKELYGKNKPINIGTVARFSGKLFRHTDNLLGVWGFTITDVIKDNLYKLANRYIEKLEV